LSAIAFAFYDDAEKWPIIFAANLEKLENPDRIYIGQSLRIPDRQPH
jgi:nucleoid-associated protein YgaU